MKLFEETTIWCKLELSFSEDADFIENFNKIFDYNNSEYNIKAEMKFYIEINGEDIWVEITRDSGFDEDYKLYINGEEVEFDENTAESILKSIKENIIKLD